jgi:superfamily II DNA or RNA helicase
VHRGDHALACRSTVHRDELVTQTLEKLAAVAPGVPGGVVKAGRDDHTAPVVVASLQTLARPHRMQNLTQPFSLAIVDEAPHAMAPSWRAVLEYLGCFEPAGSLTVGFTATQPTGLTRGGASDLITTAFASKTLGRRRRTA